MSSILSGRSPLRTALGTALGLVLMLGAAAPASAQLSVISEYVGPIADGGACSAERRNGPLYGNTGWDPAALAAAGGSFGGPGTVPALEDVQPAPQAGAHTDYCVAYAMTPDGNVQGRIGYPTTPTPAELAATHPATGLDQDDVVVEMPLGFAGAVAGRPTCPTASFGYGNYALATCPPETQVGDGQVRLSFLNGAFYNNTIFGGAAQAMFNLPPAPDELARIGVQIDPGILSPAKFQIRVKFSEDNPKRLVTYVDDTPREIKAKANNQIFQLYLETVALRFWGKAGPGSPHPTMPGPFTENGTRCGVPLQARFSADTYTGERYGFDSAPYQLTGCEALAFDPSVSVETTERTPATPTGVKVEVGLAQNAGNDPGTALLKDASVTLPAGLEVGAQVGSRAEGVELCTAAQFGHQSGAPAGCPAASRVGAVRIDSPLIDDPLQGDIFLGPQPAVGELPDLYLQASVRGETAPDTPRIKLIGKTSVSADGQITSVFPDNPELRFSKLTLQFDGGPTALFVTPRACGTTQGSARLSSWAAPGAPVERSSSLTIDQGCDLPGFAPAVSVTSDAPVAGGSAPFRVHVSRADRSPWLNDVNVALPSGLLADLRYVPECSRDAAATGACPWESRIASVTSVAGAGDQPLSLDGAMYLVQHDPGSVAGAVIVVRAKIGAIDLGDVVVPGSIRLRPTDAGLDFVTSAPTRFRGLALNLQSIVVAVDRPGFARNPTACGPLAYSATVTGEGGAVGRSDGQMAFSGCEGKRLAPNLIALLTGDIEPGGHPGMDVQLTMPDGDSGMRSAAVVLPRGVSADLTNVQNPCERADFDAQRCPPSTRVGPATARVSITNEVITGDVYLVRVPGNVLPGLGLNFTGRFAQQLMSEVAVNKEGRLVTTFPYIPDLPLRSFRLEVESRPSGPLQLQKGPAACPAETRWDGTFTGWGGQTVTDQIGLRCAAPAKVRLTRGSLSTRMFDLGGRNLRTLKVTLPSGVTFDTKQAKRKKAAWVRMAGSTGTLKFTRRSVTIRARDIDATNVRLKVNGSALKFSKRAARRKSQDLRLRLTFQSASGDQFFAEGTKNVLIRDGAVQVQELTYKKPTKKSKKSKK